MNNNDVITLDIADLEPIVESLANPLTDSHTRADRLPEPLPPPPDVQRPPALSKLRLAVIHTQLALAHLESHWTELAPLSAIHSRLRDLDLWLESLLDELPLRDPLQLDHEMLAHDAYLRVIGLVQMLHRAIDNAWVTTKATEPVLDTIDTLLDAFNPFICFADRTVRRVVLGGESIEQALEHIERELRSDGQGGSR